jgi:hypothetical protein
MRHRSVRFTDAVSNLGWSALWAANAPIAESAMDRRETDVHGETSDSFSRI